MNNRVLFVDDDPMLLSSMERCLGDEFDLTTSLSGADALQRIAQARVFGVIISDMRMPSMNGVEFLQQAMSRSPHSVRMMLTGNQDVQTAIRAVNEGQVAKFLNKPSDPREIASALRTGLKQFALESAERKLLDQTLTGAVGILTDVMESLEPTLIGRAARAEQIVEELRERVGAASHWEYKIAAKLLLVGYALAPKTGGDQPPESIRAASATAAGMVRRIPRLSQVADIIENAADSDGELSIVTDPSAEQIVANGATLLRLAQLIEGFGQTSLPASEALARLQELVPAISPETVSHVVQLYPGGAPCGGVEVAITDLKPGFVLQAHLARPDGAVLISEGRRLSQNHIDKLLADDRLRWQAEPAIVTADSYREVAEDAATPA
ncbi:MAG: response regulator [Planctomycetota bacterium]